MKKTISIFASALMLLVGVTSCNKESDSTATGTGSLEVSFNFDLQEEAESAGATKAISTAKPSTSWADIKDLLVLCVDNATGNIKAVRNVTGFPTTGPTTVTHPGVFPGIPSGTYTVYVIANAQQSNITSNIGTAASSWNEGTLVNQNISTALLKLITTASDAAVPAGQTSYSAPSDIFVGSLAGVVVPVDGVSAQAAISITRIIGMMRIRIDQSQNGNHVVDFTGANGSVQIRRATQQWSLKDLIASSPRTATNQIYVKSAFSTALPAGYSGALNLVAVNTGVSSFSDVKMFPGGSTSAGAQKFDILLCGKAPATYIAAGASAPLGVATPVYWSGQVDGVVLANNILEVDCTLKSAGSTTPPVVGTYGSLSINVTLVTWNNITTVPVPM